MQTLKIVLATSLFAITFPVMASEIHVAAQQGDLVTVRSLLSDNPSLLQEQDPFGNTPLHVAAINGHRDVAEFLVSQGAVIDAGDNEKSTPLDVAAQNGRKEVVELLVSLDANVNHRDNNNMCPILWAASGGNMDIFQLLVARGADIHARDNAGMSTLHMAAYEEHADLVEYLLNAGLNVNLRKTNGSMPLHGAALDGNIEMMELLLAKGAEIDAKNEAGYTPFLSAIAGCQKEGAEYLVSKGADMNAKLVQAEAATALLMAVGGCGETDVALWLIQNGADVNETASSGFSPLSLAAIDGKTEMVQLLLENDAMVDGEKKGFPTPLYLAVRQGHADAAELLIKNGANVNVKDDRGITPLMKAVSIGNNDIVAMLLTGGGKVDLKDKNYGRTALHFAAIKGNAGAIDLLVTHGARIDAPDKNGNTALNCAAQYAHRDVAQRLVAHGAVANREVDASFGPCKMLTEKLTDNEAALWYLGNCGYAVRTKNHLLIFDYWEPGKVPANPCLANGHINPQELADQNVTVFVTHEHADHFDPVIFDWADKVKNITYVYGFHPEALHHFRQTGYPGPEYTYIGPRETITIDDIDIMTIRANDAGVGFLVKVDGLTLYHAGDHAGWLDGEKEGYTREIDYLDDNVKDVDIAFLNVTGCHAHGEQPLWEGTCYTIDALSPRVVVPTHAWDREYIYQDYAERIYKEKTGIRIYCPENPGDRFAYSRKESS